jgi:amidase
MGFELLPSAVASDDKHGAFVEHGRVKIVGSGEGPLAGMPFAVKDQFDIAGIPTGLGNPYWLKIAPIPTETSEPVARCLDAGGVMVGKTHMDELGWSINGINYHYGTPLNSAAPDHTPGGSSSGSAAAVVGGVVPFALSGDGGGSIRVPASYCGIVGIRPTVGRLGPAPGRDRGLATAGWLAKDAQTLELVGSVLLDDYTLASAPSQVLYAQDLFDNTDPGVAEAMQAGVDRIVGSGPGGVTPVTVGGMALPQWREAYKLLQVADIRDRFGSWVEAEHPIFGPDITERFEWAKTVTDDDIAWAAGKRKAVVARMSELLTPGTVLIVPSAPGVAPLRSAGIRELEGRRAKAFTNNSAVGLVGLPQVSLPLAELNGLPLGVSLVAGRGGDEMLLSFARTILEAA